MSGFQQSKSTIRVHRNRHVFYGEIEPDTEYVPNKVEERCVHSDHALYSSVLQHDGLAQDHRFQENDERESLEGSFEDDDYLHAEDADSEEFDPLFSLGEDERL